MQMVTLDPLTRVLQSIQDGFLAAINLKLFRWFRAHVGIGEEE